MRARRWLPEGIALTIILLWAAWLRLGWPGVNLFDFDQAQVSLLALRMARGGEFAALGMPSSSVLPNFPATVWLFAIPYALSTDPLVASLWVGVTGVLMVLGVWKLARRAWGPWAGLSTALLCAASPYAVVYARDIWSQDLLAPLAVAWAVAGVIGFGERRAAALAMHIFLAGFAFQVHYAGLALVVPTAWMLIRYRPVRQWWAVLLGATGAAVCAAPALYTLACCRPAVLTGLRDLSHQPAQFDSTALTQTLAMSLGLQWEQLFLGPAWQWPAGLQSALTAAAWVSGALMALGAVALCLRRHEFDAWRAALLNLLPAWALASIVVFTRHTIPVNIHYQLIALPAFILLVGGAATLFPRWQWGAGVLAIVALMAWPRSLALARQYDTLGQTATPGGVGTPLAWPRAAAQALASTTGRIVLHAHGDDPAFMGDVAAFDVLWWDHPHSNVDGRSALLIPAQADAALFFTFPTLPAWEEAQANGLIGGVQNFPRRMGDAPYVSLSHLTGALTGFTSMAPITLDNNAQLQGWRVRRLESSWRVTTLWRIVGPARAGEYHQFNHLYTVGQTEMLAQVDVAVSSAAWQTGDTLLTWADFDLPHAAGPFTLEVGMYTLPEVARSPIVTGRPGVDPLAPIALGPFQIP